MDVGTGTGIWCADFGDEFPNCEVIGTDLSPMQPSWVPPNVRFEIDNAEDEWTWGENVFDFIHVRTLVGNIKDWDRLYQQAFKALKPGGYLEHHENSVRMRAEDDSFADDSPLGVWHTVFWQSGEKLGQTFKVVDDDVQPVGMKKAGFEEVTTRDWKCPVTPWPKDKKMKAIGSYTKMSLEGDLEGMVLPLAQ